MTRPRRLVLLLVVGTALAALLAACGSDGESSSDDNTTPAISDMDSGASDDDTAMDSGATAAAEPCMLLSDSDLTEVFGDNPIPEAEDGSVGAGYYGCEWELDAEHVNADDFNVTIAIVPVDTLQSTYFANMEPLGDIDGVTDGHSFDGTVGVTGGSSRGHSVSFSVGDVGGFVGVQQGNHGDPDTEIDLATALAKKVISQLG